MRPRTFLLLLSLLLPAARAHAQKPLAVTNLTFPAKAEWLVFWGGDTPGQNAHYRMPAQRYALDLVISQQGGKTFRGSGKRNSDYFCWDKPVYAPFDGKVTIAVNGVPDNVPGEMNPQMVYGNVAMIQDGRGHVSVLAHLKLNSLRVKLGQFVKAGALVGHCGNSGNSSEPHLHFHVQSQNGFEKGTGLKPYFKKVRVNGKTRATFSPVKNDRIANQGDLLDEAAPLH